MTPRRLLLKASVAFLLVAGCTVGPQAPDPDPVPGPEVPGVTTTALIATVRVKVEGAEQVEVDEEMRLVAVEVSGDDVPPDSHLISLGTREAVALADGRELRFSVGVGSGNWRGPGEYRLDGEQEATTIPDEVFVELALPGDPEVARYAEFVEPCTATIGASGFGGSVTCPALRQELGEGTVSVSITWVGGPDPMPDVPFITPPPVFDPIE